MTRVGSGVFKLRAAARRFTTGFVEKSNTRSGCCRNECRQALQHARLYHNTEAFGSRTYSPFVESPFK